jgi:aspartyl aminopeptidase
LDLLRVYPFGGPDTVSWVDRDLKIAGRAITADRQIRLFETQGGVCVIPSISQTIKAKFGVQFSADKDLVPVISFSNAFPAISSTQSSALVSVMSRELGVVPEEIVDFEAQLVDSNPPGVIGVNGELLAGQNVDSLSACFAGLFAFLEGEPAEGFRCFTAFDSGNIRSWANVDLAGPLSNFLTVVVQRVGIDAVALEKSLMIGIENREGRPWIEPHKGTNGTSYPMGKWDPGDGVVLLSSDNRTLVTNLEAETAVKRMARTIGVELNMLTPADTEIDPSVVSWSSTNLGVRTASIGVPALGIATIRPVVAVSDILKLHGLLKVALAEWIRFNVIEDI